MTLSKKTHINKALDNLDWKPKETIDSGLKKQSLISKKT